MMDGPSADTTALSKNQQKKLLKQARIAEQKAARKQSTTGAAHTRISLEEGDEEDADLPSCHEQDGPSATLMRGKKLHGKDKWLGGELGLDGNIYGVPGSAKSVVKVNVSTQEVSEIGHNMKGPYIETSLRKNQFKWLRGARGKDGAIYGVPSNANQVLRITPDTGECVAIGGPWPGLWKWHGGVMGRDGNIYGIPCNAEQVLKIDTVTGECSLFGGPYPGRLKWYGGLLGCDGCIYGIANCSEHVIKIDPVNQTTELIGQLSADLYKWHGGAVGSDGCIYGFPSHYDRVLKIDPRTGFCEPVGDVIDVKSRGGRYKYGGGVLGCDGFVYCFPSDADRVLQIRCGHDAVKLIGPEYEGRNKWQNGFLARDGCIYGIPCDGANVIKIDCAAETVELMGGPWEGDEKWEGGVVGTDGCLYAMPQQALKVLKIAPGPPREGLFKEESEKCQWMARQFEEIAYLALNMH